MTNTGIDSFPAISKVWVYASSRELTPDEATFTQEALNNFTARWTAHNEQLKAAGVVLERSFIILMVDESQAGASGCSIDSSVAFIKVLGEKLGVDLFDRLTFVYRDSQGAVSRIHKNDLSAAYATGLITDDSLFFNTLVANKDQLDHFWEQPLSKSWHKNFI